MPYTDDSFVYSVQCSALDLLSFFVLLLGTLLWLPDVSQTFLLAKIWTLHHSNSILNQAQGAAFWDQVTTTCSSKVRPKTELYWFVFCFSEEARPLYTGNHRKVDERISFIFAEQNSIWGAYRCYRVWPPCASLMFSKPEKRGICVGFKTKHLKQHTAPLYRTTNNTGFAHPALPTKPTKFTRVVNSPWAKERH